MKFAAVVLQARSSEPRLPLQFECIPGHLPSARFPPYGRFACVWLLTCACSLRNVGFCSFYAPSAASPGGIFPDSFPYCFGKPIRTVFLMVIMKCIWTTRPIFTEKRCFSTKEIDGGKKTSPWTICKNISTCLKNLSQTTYPLGWSYGPLVWRQGGPTPLFRDLCAASTQAGTPSEARCV